MSEDELSVNDWDASKSSTSTKTNGHDFFKRRKLNKEAPSADVDQRKPIFLKINFRKGSEPEEPDLKVEDDATYSARPWQETSTIVPVLVAFRAQFSDVFDGVPDLGPQDLEEGVEAEEPSLQVQEFMCRLLTLAANRAKPVENPHYNRPLSDTVALYYATRGHPSWEGRNPLSGNKRFIDLTTDDRLKLMQCLLEWAMTESKVVRDMIEEGYKNRNGIKIQTHNPYEMDVIGRDDKKHGYYLLKGRDTRFRLYIQTDLSKQPARWYSICSTLDDLRKLTSNLSDTARTVRCRKIVDDLASIHIPEVERAQDAMRQADLKRQRAEYERNRKAAYAAELAESISERGSRTRGRRVNYRSMLAGQGEDEDGNYSPASSLRSGRDHESINTPQASRSGRMIRKPRAFDDASVDEPINGNSRDISAAPSVNMDVDQESDDDLSHVVILRYNKDAYESRSQKHQSLAVEGAPIKAEDAQHVAAADPSAEASVPESIPETTMLQEDSGPPDVSIHAPNHPRASATNPGTIATSSSANRNESSTLVRRAIVLAPIDDQHRSVEHLDSLLKTTVERAISENIDQLYVLLSSTAGMSQDSSTKSPETFVALQKTISTVYLSIAKHATNLGKELDSTIIFADWCGYTMATEDISWTFIATLASSNNVSTKFIGQHTEHFKGRLAPEVVLVEGPTEIQNGHSLTLDVSTPARYDIVAVGGTFDHLHAGHKILLTMTASMAEVKVICGLTDDALLVNKKHKEVMQTLSERTSCVRSFFHTIRRDLEYDLVPISDVAGPTGTDATIQALVASRETEAGSEQIRQIRKDKNLPPLDIVFIDVVGAHGVVSGDQMAELKLSSTAIREKLAKSI